MKGGHFYVKDGVLEPVSEADRKAIAGLDGQVFRVSLDDEQPLNDRQRAAYWCLIRDFIENLPRPALRVFWQLFHSGHYAPLEDKLLSDTLKGMYGIKSIADGACSKQELSDYVQWAEARMEEIASACRAYAAEQERRG